jgi:hypothetical protein
MRKEIRLENLVNKQNVGVMMCLKEFLSVENVIKRKMKNTQLINSIKIFKNNDLLDIFHDYFS